MASEMNIRRFIIAETVCVVHTDESGKSTIRVCTSRNAQGECTKRERVQLWKEEVA